MFPRLDWGCAFGKNNTQAIVHSQGILWRLMVWMCLIIGDVKLWALGQGGVCWVSLHCKLTRFPFVINKYLGGMWCFEAVWVSHLQTFAPWFWHSWVALLYNDYYCGVCLVKSMLSLYTRQVELTELKRHVHGPRNHDPCLLTILPWPPSKEKSQSLDTHPKTTHNQVPMTSPTLFMPTIPPPSSLGWLERLPCSS